VNARQAAFAGALAILCTSLCYLALTAAQVTPLWYVPLAQRWTWHLPPGAVGIDFYFRGGASLAAGALGFALGFGLARRAAWPTRPGTLRLVFGLGFAVMAWAALFMVFTLATTPRQRTPTGAAHGHADDND
jgi:hypothetical protein